MDKLLVGTLASALPLSPFRVSCLRPVGKSGLYMYIPLRQGLT